MADSLFTTRLFIEGYELELSDNIDIANTYAIATVQDISKTSSGYSKSITIPGTAKNNELMNFLYNIKSTGEQANYDPDQPNIGYNYNFKKKAKAYVVQDNMVVLSGYAKLQGATINNNRVTYEIQITSELGGLIAALGDSKLEDLDEQVPEMTSVFTHNAGPGEVVSSWDAEPCTSYFYPLIDYGQYDTLNGVNFYVDNLRPCLFAKQYLDMIFASVGYTYDSGFINSDFFKRLIIPYVDGNITQTGKATSITRQPSGVTLIYPATTGGTSSFPFDAETYDDDGNYNISNQRYTAPDTGKYSLEFEIPFKVQALTDPYGGIFINGVKNNHQITFELSYDRYDSGDTFLGNSQVQIAIFDPGQIQFQGTTYTSDILNLSFKGFEFYLNSGDYVRFKLQAKSGGPDATMFTTFPLSTTVEGSVNIELPPRTNDKPFIIISKSSLFVYSDVVFQQFVPKNVRQADYINSILKLFNLYPVIDKDKPKHFNIYTRDEFYSLGENKNWTDKQDTASDVEITPIPNLDAKQFYFSYKEDKDWWNTQYSSLYGGNYGDLRLDTGYEFTKDVKKVMDKIIFSPTPPVEYDNVPLPCEESAEVMVADRNVVQTTGFNEIVGDDLPDSGGFTKAREGGRIRWQDGSEYVIVSVQNPFQFTVAPMITRSGGAIDGTFYAVADTFSYLSDNDKTFPCIYQTSDNNVTRKPLKVNPRILYYAGKVSCNEFVVQETPPLTGRDRVAMNRVITDEYPYVSHLNAATSPTHDLLFEQPKALFFNFTDTYPTFNLYTGYWRNTVNEILDNEAKLVRSSIKLTSIDVANLDLNDSIFIDGTKYRINKITDYKPDRSILTDVELIRQPYQDLIENPVYVPTTTDGPGLINIYNQVLGGMTVDKIIMNGDNVVIFNGLPIPYSSNNRFGRYKSGTWGTLIRYNNASGTHYLRVTDANGSVQNSPQLPAGNGTYFFPNVVVKSSNNVLVEVLDASTTTTTTSTSTTTTTTTTTTSTTLPPAFVRAEFNITGVTGDLIVTWTDGPGSATLNPVIATHSVTSAQGDYFGGPFDFDVEIDISNPSKSYILDIIRTGVVILSEERTGDDGVGLTNITLNPGDYLLVRIREVGSTTTTSTTTTTTSTTTTLPPGDNFFVENNMIDSVIDNVTPSVYLISEGAFPVSTGNSISGLHGSFSSALGVEISSYSTPITLQLYKNGLLEQSINVFSNGTHTFSALGFGPDDECRIIAIQ